MNVLLEKALELPTAERRRLAEDIYDSLFADDGLQFSQDQITEFERRAEFAKNNPDRTIPWEVVRDGWRDRK